MDDRYLEKVRFLIVDDNVFIRNLVRRVLAVLGATDIKEAGDGAEGLRVLGGFAPDIVILDWEMRPMDGLEFAKQMRQGLAGPSAFCPIIMLSAYSEKERVVTARDSGINEFVVKPFTANRLYGRIQQVIEKPRQFIKTDAYLGPDRRRRDVGPPKGADRRKPEKKEK
jgi:two-component system chemotaxis response regulator CheY